MKKSWVMLVPGLNVLENPIVTLHKGSGYKFTCFKFALFPKRNFNVWMWTFYRDARNAYGTAGIISSTWCELGGVCLWFVGLWDCWLHCGSNHAWDCGLHCGSNHMSKLDTNACAFSARLAKQFVVGSQIISLYQRQSFIYLYLFIYFNYCVVNSAIAGPKPGWERRARSNNLEKNQGLAGSGW
jgi:hypothetical protein